MTTILGLGEFSAGTESAGLWVEEEDESTDTNVGVRFIDPRTRDYARDADGNFIRGSAARQRMVIALTTAFGSSLAARGVRFPAKHDSTARQVTEAEIRTVTQPMVDDATVQIDAIKIEVAANRVPGRLGIEVQFTNLETGEEEEPLFL